MTISQIKAIPISYPLEVPARDATGIWESWDTVIVKVTASDGTVGYGEIGPAHGGGVQVFQSIVEHRLKNLILGEDPFNREGLFEKMLGHGTAAYAFGQKGALVSAIAGVDTALWDLVGKVLKTPVYQLLGGGVYRRIPAYASGFFGKGGKPLSPKECAEEAKFYADQGFKGVKMKIGFGRKRDLENLEAVRKALGPDLGIMVDANQGFAYSEVMKIARDLEPFDLTFLEEPIPIFDLEGMATLRQHLSIPLAAGENYYTRYEFQELLNHRAVDVVQPDIIHAGGITETKKIAALALSQGIKLSPHIHATIGVAASIHLLASCTNTFAAEYITSGGSYDLRRALYGDCYLVDKDGYIPVPEEPGLGIRLNEKALEQYALKIP
ncbi:MAG: mandelate racemase/muconate lactonizing enzyme family protein [Spirochaetales bacterium]